MSNSDFSPLTEAQMDKIAERAATKAVEKLTDRAYREIGKSVVSKFLWIVGVLSAAVFLWFQSKGLIK